MKIGLIDVDSHNFPNLCLMKLSAYHKAKGHILLVVLLLAAVSGGAFYYRVAARSQPPVRVYGETDP